MNYIEVVFDYHIGKNIFLSFNYFQKYTLKTLQNALKSVFTKNIFFDPWSHHEKKSQQIIFSKTLRNVLKPSKKWFYWFLSLFEKNNLLLFFHNGGESIKKKKKPKKPFLTHYKYILRCFTKNKKLKIFHNLFITKIKKFFLKKNA